MPRKKEVLSDLDQCRAEKAELKATVSNLKLEVADLKVRLDKEKRRADQTEGELSFEAGLAVCKAQVESEINGSGGDAARQWSLVMLKKALAGL